ncbi:hypothetical protein N7456_004226 [Penicillium angulare]|uniref:DUF2423 domain-containing protein n=1 Tax=Penicillium angulare TaxID=116970 RepID=A0A9W9KJ08_9EURO|nr:hypothetical protein N7456_004226 [Penicillium angulare]
MAKSVRASVSKRNRANLRKKVFGPVVDARTERLAAKLQELASQPRPETSDKSEMELESGETADQDSGAKAVAADEAMDVDTKSSKRSQKSGRVQKNKKPRNSIVFKAHPSKAKKGPKRK